VEEAPARQHVFAVLQVHFDNEHFLAPACAPKLAVKYGKIIDERANRIK
jgi:hypothetical protein